MRKQTAEGHNSLALAEQAAGFKYCEKRKSKALPRQLLFLPPRRPPPTAGRWRPTLCILPEAPARDVAHLLKKLLSNAFCVSFPAAKIHERLGSSCKAFLAGFKIATLSRKKPKVQLMEKDKEKEEKP